MVFGGFFYFIIIIVFCLFVCFLFFSLNIRPSLNPNEFIFLESSHREYHVWYQAPVFWLAFIDRSRGKRARPGTFVLKSLKKKLLPPTQTQLVSCDSSILFGCQVYAVGLNRKRRTMTKSSYETVKLKQMAKKTSISLLPDLKVRSL